MATDTFIILLSLTVPGVRLSIIKSEGEILMDNVGLKVNLISVLL